MPAARRAAGAGSFQANASVRTVQKWAISQTKPTGTALKLLHLVRQRGIDAAV